MLPLVLLVGQAGSGKDTVADFLVKNHGAIAISQADPLKRFAQQVFQFTDQQLWGPSEFRNAIDRRYSSNSDEWVEAFNRLHFNMFPFLSDIGRASGFHLSLMNWFKDLRNLTGDLGITPRLVLQTLGTEWGRIMVTQEIWIDYASRTALNLLTGKYKYSPATGCVKDDTAHPPTMVVVTDGRFLNEVTAVAKLNGHIWKIECPQADGSLAENSGIKGHASELEQKSIQSSFYDVVLINDKTGGLDSLAGKVNRAAQTLERAALIL